MQEPAELAGAARALGNLPSAVDAAFHPRPDAAVAPVACTDERESIITGSSVRVGVGTRFLYDGDPFEVVDMQATTAGNELVLRGMRGRRDLLRVSLRELLTSERARVIPDMPGPSSDDPDEPASVVLAELTES